VKVTIFEILATSKWQLALSRTVYANLYRSLGLGLGLGMGHPRVTPGSPKGDARATQGARLGRFEVLSLFSTELRKRPGGDGNRVIGSLEADHSTAEGGGATGIAQTYANLG
jgi:hypothetical protein